MRSARRQRSLPTRWARQSAPSPHASGPHAPQPYGRDSLAAAHSARARAASSGVDTCSITACRREPIKPIGAVMPRIFCTISPATQQAPSATDARPICCVLGAGRQARWRPKNSPLLLARRRGVPAHLGGAALPVVVSSLPWLQEVLRAYQPHTAPEIPWRRRAHSHQAGVVIRKNYGNDGLPEANYAVLGCRYSVREYLWVDKL